MPLGRDLGCCLPPRSIGNTVRMARRRGRMVRRKNEQDPFDKSKSTFIAENVGGEGMLAIRCLEGTFLIGCVGAIQRVCERCR